MNTLPKTSIVILVYNNLKYTIDCIDSIRKYTKPNTYEIVVVDNHSTDNTKEWLLQQRDVVSVINDENYGFPKGCNLGIKAASPENDILLLNNDTIMTPSWLENLLAALYSDERVGAVGPVSNSVSNNQQVNVQLTCTEDIESYGEKFNKSNPKLWEEKQLLIGFCFLIKRSVLEKIGCLDELYSPGNFEDSDYSLRVIEAGFKLLLCNDTFIYHEGSATFRDNPEVYGRFLDNREKFNDKWGFDHGMMMDYRQEILDLFNVDEEAEFSVLEIGCGAAMNLLKIRYKYPNSKVFGLEPNPSLAKIAKNLVPLYLHDLEDFPYQYEEEQFDYIILRDTLHHVTNPFTFIGSISKYLKPDGHILCSMSNLGNVENFLNIFGGYFYLHNKVKAFRNYFTFGDISHIFIENNFNLVQGRGSGKSLNEDAVRLIDLLVKEGFASNANNLMAENLYLDFEK